MNSALANNGANFNDIDNSNEFDSAYTTANTTNNYPSVDPSNDASSVSSHTETSSDDLEPTIVHPTQAPFNREGNGLTRDAHEPVAIVGMGCRWPGGVHDTSAFWEFLCNKVDGWKEFGHPRYSKEGFHHPNSDRPGGFAMKGAFLAEQDARLFDHSFFSMTSLEVETMDPSQRKLLEVAYEAIENAGDSLDSISGSRTGVFVGNFCLDHWMIQSRDWENPRPYAFVGAGTSILANRISYIFNLHGPSLTVDTACSSSMYALHLAMNSIRAGDCDSAIVASANWIGDPAVQIALDKLGALSASGRCHTFDARAEGYARGEGYGAIYLKRVPLAVSDMSPIRAVIRGTAINSNGRTGGITRPSAEGQETVIREAYRNAGGLSFKDTSYFECHGTGTYVGDPIEVEAVGNVFSQYQSKDDPLLVGSVKSNVGHGEGASALASIMKIVLALENNAIPPIFDLQTRNPNIDFDAARVLPVTEVTPWPKNRLRRASINSFGYGGANGHCILDHVHNVLPDYIAPGVFRKHSNTTKHGHKSGLLTNGATDGHHKVAILEHRPILQAPSLIAKSSTSTRQLVLLPFSAHNESSLKLNVESLAKVVDQVPLADVAYTLSNNRSKFAWRSFCIVDKENVLEGLVLDKKPLRAPLHTANVGYVFTGQGAQWHGMGGKLFEYRVFKNTIEYLDQVLGFLRSSSSHPWTLGSVLRGECDAGLVQTPEVSQAVCTALQIGLVDLLASWSVRPSSVAGHSSGEIAAAYASGRVTAAEAIQAAYLRGQAVSTNRQKGAMLAVGLGPDEAEVYLQSHKAKVKIAAINSPGSVTLSGDESAIDQISTDMTTNSVFNRKLKTGGNAYHSHHMLSIGRGYIDMLKEGSNLESSSESDSSAQRYPEVFWSSSVSPGTNTSKITDFATYWKANLESPVRFSEAVTQLVGNEECPVDILVEIGPHSALKSPVEQILKSIGSNVLYSAALKRQEDAQRSILELAGTLCSVNTNINIAAVNAIDQIEGKSLEHGVTSAALPPYQYTYGALNYYESRASKEWRYRSVLKHDLLGSGVVGTAKLRPQWRNTLRIKSLPWLGDHRLIPDAVLPGAAYLAMAIEAASRVYNEAPEPLKIEGFVLENVTISSGLVVPEDDYGIEVLTSMELLDSSTVQSQARMWATFSVSSVGRETNQWTEHCTGHIKILFGEEVQPQHIPVPATSRAVDANAWYKTFAQIGLGYGPTFQPLSNITIASESNLAVATVNLKTTSETIKGGESRYPLHPASLDGAIQLGLVACHAGKHNEASTAFVPVHVSRMYLSNSIDEIAGEECTVVARGERRGIRGAHLDLHLLGRNGEVLLQVDDLRCTSFSSAAKSSAERDFSSPFTRLVWRPDISTLKFDQARSLYPPPEANVKKAPSWAITNKLAHFVVYSLYMTFGTSQPKPEPVGDVGHFFQWIQRMGQNNRSAFMEEARRLADEGRILQVIEELVSQAPDVMEVKIAKLLHDDMADILHGHRTGIDVILGENLLTPLYQEGLLMTGIYPQLDRILKDIAHSNPNARVLEIGGGTGGATRIAMKAFNGANNIKAYQSYTFTDISGGFLSAARESFAHAKDMLFSVFDIEIDPIEQGYVEQGYDLIIACQVLHATSNMHRTLTNCRRLLKPGGRLVLVETTQNFVVPGVVVGTFTGYWSGIPDGRVDAPFQSLSGWDRSLRSAGFSGLDVVLDDFPEPQNTTSVIVSQVPVQAQESVQATTIYVLHSSERAPSLVQHVSNALQQKGIFVKVGTLHDTVESLPAASHVVAFFHEDHLLNNVEDHQLRFYQQLSQISETLIVVTSCGTIKGRNPDGALIPGLLRVLQNENPATEYLSIDVDAENFDIGNQEGKNLALCIVDHQARLQHHKASTGENEDPIDREFSWQDGCLWISRHVPDAGFHSQHGLDSRRTEPELLPLERSKVPLRTTFGSPGVLESLCFTPYTEILQPLQPNYIDVSVSAIGLNSQDIDHWVGRVNSDYLSSEFAGVVTAVGNGVNNLKIGDRVYGLGKGQFGTYTRVPAEMTSRLRSGDEMVKMASMPLAYATAIYALDFTARIRKGQSVLVQSADKDVGLALVCLAKSKGADVFAMVDTTEQASFLINELAMPASHVLLSASSFKTLQNVVRTTHREDFDVIIASAPGELLQSFLQILAPVGHFVDVNPSSQRTVSPRGLESFPHNVSYSSVNILSILGSDPALAAELMQMVDKYYRQGLIQPFPSIKTVDIADLGSTIGNFSKLVGKLVVSFENPKSVVRTIPSPPSYKFDPEAYYIVTGGLGGLGQSLVRWMGNRGAKNMVILSRRDISSVPQAQEVFSALAKSGIHAQPIQCDVTDEGQVMRIVQSLASKRPIKGVVHAAVSYLDLTFDRLSASRWNEGLSAKVAGTKNLHKALFSTPLDFFVMTTSALSVFAFPTQGAYTVANNFQDAFARYRRRLGLPASTVSFSLIREISEVGSTDLTVNLFERNKTLMLNESEFLTLLEPAFLNNKTAAEPSPDQWHGQLDDPLSAANLHTYLDPAGLWAKKRKEIEEESSSSNYVPRWHSDARISLMMRALSDAQTHSVNANESAGAESKNTPAAIRKEFDEAVQRGPAERDTTVAFVKNAIINAVAEVLFVDVESIDPAKSVAGLGVDSLIAAELRNWFLRALSANISMLDLLNPGVSITTRATTITEKALDC